MRPGRTSAGTPRRRFAPASPRRHASLREMPRTFVTSASQQGSPVTRGKMYSVKLRIKDNSIRLRLTRTEVDALRDDGLVASRTGFPGNTALGYRVESSPASVSPAAFFSDNAVTVRLPESAVIAWATADQVSMSGEQLLDDGSELKILVEKDFACLTEREGEDESDMFPHPDAGAQRC